MFTRTLLFVASVFFSSLALGQGGDPRFDPTSGRNLANYPPSVLFDHKHLKIELDIPDIETAAFNGVATLTVSPIATARSSITLDARRSMTFSSVTVNGAQARFTHAGDRLTVDFPTPLEPAAEGVIVLTYTAQKPFAAGSGLCWFKTRPGREAQGAIIYSQGQSIYNSYWFPCHDSPNEKMTTEVVVTVDSGYETVSNGRLLSKTPGESRTRWHWLQDKPHAAYLIMLAVGKFDVVDVNEGKGGLAMPVYGPPGSKEGLKEVYANTPAMVAFFEKQFDEPYPWDKYAQVIVRNFRWGGMENTSATVLAEYAATGGPRAHDDLIAHELVHQWWGDLTTCKSWDHLWLNEGWATFGEWLWVQHRDGDDAYYKSARDARNILRLTANEPFPKGVAMVSRYFDEPDDTFMKAEDPYKRGGFFLHMLRERLGDETFWKGARLFLDRYKFTSVETDQFRLVMEEVSGQSLERFFDQWARRPGMPTLRVKTRFDESSNQLTVTVDQTQPINAENPAYALRLPVFCQTSGEGEPSSGTWVYVETDTRSASKTFDLPVKPVRFRIDPNVTLLVKFEEGETQPQ